MANVRNIVTVVPSDDNLKVHEGFRSKTMLDKPNDNNDSKKTSDPHVNNILNKIDPTRAEPKVAQGQLNKGKIDDQQKQPPVESQTKYLESKELAKGLNNLATNGNVSRTSEKQSTGQSANMQTAQQTPQTQPRTPQPANSAQQNSTPANPTQQNIVTGKPIAEPRQPNNADGTKPKQVVTAENARAGERAKLAGYQLANIQAGTNASVLAGAEKIKQQNLNTADNTKETEKSKEDDKTSDTPQVAHAKTAHRSKKFDQLAGGMGGGVEGDADDNEPQLINTLADKTGEVHEDHVTYLEKAGEEIGFRVISPTTEEELQGTELKLAAVKYDNVEKLNKPTLTLVEIMKNNTPNQKLVDLIVADTKEAIAKAREYLNTKRTNVYGLMSA